MCGRFVLTATEEEICEVFAVDHVHQGADVSYNIAPTHEVSAIVSKAGQRHLGKLSWGLIPQWSREVGSRRPINARSETAHEKASFRAPFRKRRCLIPASGFYEWQKSPQGKIPMFIHLPNEPLFAMAGLWDRWSPPEQPPLSTCTILTTEANSTIQPIHDRMPVILPQEHWGLWLNNESFDLRRLQEVMQPYPAEAFSLYPVNKQVNRVNVNNASNLERYEEPLPPENLSLF